MKRTTLWPLVVLLCTAVIAWLLISNKPQLEPQNISPALTAVRTVTVAPQTIQLSVSSQGSVAPRTESFLVSEVSGRVMWISPALVAGGRFEKDEPLLRIDQRDYQSAVARGESAEVKTLVELEHHRAEYERIEKLHQQQLASRSQLDQAERALRLATANLDEARINLEQARRDLGRTTLYAPFAGRVRNENIDIGQFISRGEKIGSLYATDYFEIRVPIANEQFAYLDLTITSGGQIPEDKSPAVKVTASYANQPFQWQGRLVRTEAEIDQRSRMFYGVVRVKNRHFEGQAPLIVGLFVNVTISGRSADNIVALPRTAIRDNNQVLIVDKDERLRFRPVTLLRIEHDRVLVSSGLKSGERVCISPLQVVTDGMLVKALAEEEKAPGLKLPEQSPAGKSPA